MDIENGARGRHPLRTATQKTPLLTIIHTENGARGRHPLSTATKKTPLLTLMDTENIARETPNEYSHAENTASNPNGH